jgi:bacillithiol system protein YtxJ
VNGPIGTSTCFFPFTTDYFTVPNRTALKLATRTQRNKVSQNAVKKKAPGFVPGFCLQELLDHENCRLNLIFLIFTLEKNRDLLENNGLNETEVNMKIYFKHSTRCPVSARAKREMDNYLKSKPDDIEFELIDVISNRGRSDEIAQQFDVEHESPQVIVIDDHNNVIWTGSHRGVTEENLNQAIAGNR